MTTPPLVIPLHVHGRSYELLAGYHEVDWQEIEELEETDVRGDGFCLYHSILYSMGLSKENSRTTEFMIKLRSNPAICQLDQEMQLSLMKQLDPNDSSAWGEDIAIGFMAIILRIKIIAYQTVDGKLFKTIYGAEFESTIRIRNYGNYHYKSLETDFDHKVKLRSKIEELLRMPVEDCDSISLWHASVYKPIVSDSLSGHKSFSNVDELIGSIISSMYKIMDNGDQCFLWSAMRMIARPSEKLYALAVFLGFNLKFYHVRKRAEKLTAKLESDHTNLGVKLIEVYEVSEPTRSTWVLKPGGSRITETRNFVIEEIIDNRRSLESLFVSSSNYPAELCSQKLSAIKDRIALMFGFINRTPENSGRELYINTYYLKRILQVNRNVIRDSLRSQPAVGMIQIIRLPTAFGTYNPEVGTLLLAQTGLIYRLGTTTRVQMEVRRSPSVISRSHKITSFPETQKHNNNLYDYAPRTQETFYHPNAEIYEAVDVKTPSVITEIVDNHIVIKLNTDDKGWSVSDSIKQDFVYRKRLMDAKNIVHDFVFDILSTETDKSFKGADLSIGGISDNWSPDVIISRESDPQYEDIVVYEFTTRSTESIESLLRSVEVKSLRYKEAIQERAITLKKRISYYTICVSVDAVATNLLSLPADVCRELIIRLRVANQVKIQLADNDINLDSATLLAPDIYRIKEMFRESFPNNKFIHPITKEMYEHFVNPMISGEKDYVANLKSIIDKETRDEQRKNLKSLKVVDGKKYTERKAETALNEMSQAEEHYRSYFENDNFRSTLKAPVQLPLIIPDVSSQDNQFSNKELSDRIRKKPIDHPVYNIWDQAVNKRNCSIALGHLDELEISMLEGQVAKKVEESYKKDRSQYNRTTLLTNMKEDIYLAERGINAKKRLEEPDVKFNRDQYKRPFHPFVSETRDIEQFTQKECPELNEESGHCSLINVEDLVLSARELHEVGDLEHLWNNIKTHSKTKFALCVKFISDLATELAISLSQNCKEDTYVVKKLRDFSCYVLIKPVNLKSNVVFSLYIPSNIYKSHNTTFKTMIGSPESGYMTDFVSANVSKLVNWVRCEAMMLAQRGFWREFYAVAPSIEEQDGMAEPESVCQMMSWTLLILLNDKHQLEEMITVSRFVHMEGFVTFPAWPKPYKMFDKLSVTPRSRLECLVIKRLIMLMKHYSENPIKFMIEDEKKKWFGFKNMFLLDCNGKLADLSDQDQMLNLFYLGYLKNKDEEVEDNGMGQLLTKILGFESAMPKTRDFLGMKDPEYGTIKKHEFSISYVKDLCDKFLDRLKKTHGIKDPITYLGDKIAKFLSTQFIETMASLKASSNFSEDYYLYTPSRRLKNQEQSRSKHVIDAGGNISASVKGKLYHRSKVIEKLTTLIKDETPGKELKIVVDLLPKAMEVLNKNECMHICIFKKNQHGGLREIYVLNIFERIMQKTVEDFSRAILECCPSETMTSPKNKFRIPELHNMEARKTLKNEYMTISTSDDASKWNQGHYVSKFMCMLLRLTPTYYHGFLVQALQLWHHKKIFLGDQLLQLFNQNAMLNTMDSTLMKVFQAYKGEIQVPWMKAGRSYIETETGMMQGILHYTSSLFHAIFLDQLAEECRRDINRAIKTINNKENEKVSCIVNNMESSDDSSFIISIPNFKENEAAQLYLLCVVNSWFRKKEKLGTYLGIYKSPKSTTQTLFVMEFNSEFFFSGDVHRPTFRWVNAAVLIGEQETLSGIQEELSNTLKDVIEGGGTYALTFIVQVAQAMIHYRMLGSSASSVWPAYETLLKNSYDPALGFFLMDNPKCAGLLGFNYNVWIACTTTPLGEKYHEMIQEEMKAESQSLKSVTEDTINTGLVSRTTMVGFGNKKRWMKLMTTLNLSADVYEKIEEEPRVYFFHAATAEQIIQKIAIKMKSPGVIQSLSKGNMLARKIASSVFFISRHIVFTMSAYYDADPETRKTSLLKELINSSKIPQRHDYLQEPHTLKPTKVEVDEDSWEFKSAKEECIRILKQRIKIHTGREERSISLLFENMAKSMIGRCTDQYDVRENVSILACALKMNYSIFKKDAAPNRYLLDEKNLVYPLIGKEVSVYVKSDKVHIEISEKKERLSTKLFNIDKMKDIEETLSLLFPSYGDYLSLKETIDQVTFQSAIHKVNERRRVRADVHLTGTEGFSKLPMYTAAVWAWFDVKTIPAHDSIYRTIWKVYKEQYSWLSDTLKETVEKGPFKTVQGVVNFISRAGVRSRVVHLVGSFGKNVRGSINLVTAIKDNFSNGLVFKGNIFDIKAKKTRESLDNYLSICTTLSQAPITKHDKNQILRSLFVSGPRIQYVSSQFGSRRNRMSILQEVVADDPTLHWPDQDTSQKQLEDKFRELAHKELPFLTEKVFHDHLEKIEHLMKENTHLGGRDVDASKTPYVLARANDIEIHCYELWREYDEDEDEAYQAYCSEVEAAMDQEKLNALIERYHVDPKANWIQMLMNGEIETVEELNKLDKGFESHRLALVERIRVGKLGILGSYTKCQQRIEELDGEGNKTHRYTGEGIWRGSFDDSDVCIVVQDLKKTRESYLKCVVFSKVSDYKVLMGHLKTWCREHHISNDEFPTCTQKELLSYGVTKSSVLLYKMNGMKMLRNMEKGIPLYWNPSLSTRSQTYINWLAVDITDHSLRLRNRTVENGRVVNQTIMVVPLYKTDVQIFKTSPVDLEQDVQNDRLKLLSVTKAGELRWLQDWIMWRSSAVDDLNILNQVRRNKAARDHFNAKPEFKKWIKELWDYALDTTLINKKVFITTQGSESQSTVSSGDSDSAVAPLTDEAVDEIHDLLDKELEKGTLKQIIHDATIDAQLDIPAIESFLAEEMEVFKSSLAKSHPLLLNYVRYMIQEIGVTNFRSLIDSFNQKDPLKSVSLSIIDLKEVFKFVYQDINDAYFVKQEEDHKFDF
uniref:RNA-directed RNA polymerase L n=1 Tax=Tenuivirus oryzaclavatae TaxID=3052763 RepID=D7NNC1_9VIRU|nr:RNA polymerase [Tenuivirus oryzaclavatae]